MFRSSTIIYILLLQPTELKRGRLPLRERRHSNQTKQTQRFNHFEFCLLLINKDFVINCDRLLRTYSFFCAGFCLTKASDVRKTTPALVNKIWTKLILLCVA